MIGDEVWIGINATIVGNVHIGNDVLIAPGLILILMCRITPLLSEIRA